MLGVVRGVPGNRAPISIHIVIQRLQLRKRQVIDDETVEKSSITSRIDDRWFVWGFGSSHREFEPIGRAVHWFQCAIAFDPAKGIERTVLDDVALNKIDCIAVSSDVGYLDLPQFIGWIVNNDRISISRYDQCEFVF